MKIAAVHIAVLRAVALRPTPTGPYRPVIDGLSEEQIDAAVEDLHHAGYLVAQEMPTGLGDDGGSHFEPTELTDLGRRLFEKP